MKIWNLVVNDLYVCTSIINDLETVIFEFSMFHMGMKDVARLVFQRI